jgi:peptidoglycan-associated lipoprotein
MRRGEKVVFFVVVCVLAVFVAGLAGCRRQPPPARPTAPPPADTRTTPAPTGGPAPTIEIQASPTTLERGEQTTLSWRAQNASSVVIDAGVGNVQESGSVVVTPRESTTFTATATGPGGSANASTRVTVVAGRDAGVTSTDIDGLRAAISDGRVKDIFFDYDRAELSREARATLEQNARWFRQFPSAGIVIEGHCDERGTEEYNLALGDRRAQATREYLVQLGVSPEQLEAISLGEERPFAPGHDEASYAQNRRAHFALRR